MNMADETKLCIPFIQHLKPLLCDMLLGIIAEKIWALSVDQYWLQVLFSVHLIDLLSILLKCNDFTRIQAHLTLGSALELLSQTTELVIAGGHIKSIFCPVSQSNQEMVHCCRIELEKTTFQNDNFFICGQLMRCPLFDPFHLSNLLQMANDHRIVNIEFLGNFLSSCKRINFSDPLSCLL